MSRRFRPFYVAAAAVVMVGLFGTQVVPRSHTHALPESASIQSIAPEGENSEWLGPLETRTSGLLDLTSSLSILPFNIAQ